MAKDIKLTGTRTRVQILQAAELLSQLETLTTMQSLLRAKPSLKFEIVALDGNEDGGTHEATAIIPNKLGLDFVALIILRVKEDLNNLGVEP